MAEQNLLESVSLSVVESMTRGEIESQIDIAKRWPRTMEKFKKRAIEMACIDDETAASCIYRRPVGKENGVMKYAEGMSIRLAEIVGASYGNLRVYATVISQNERQVVARGMAIDLEANFASSSEVIEATVTSSGEPYSERMRTVVAKAALAKARRDATFQVVPRALAKPVEAEVRRVLVGDAKSLETRRKAILAWIGSLGIEPKRVYGALGINGIDDVGLEHIETLTGIRTAIKDGEVEIDEAFPREALKAPQPLKEVKRDEEQQGDKGKGQHAGVPGSGKGSVRPSAKVAAPANVDERHAPVPSDVSPRGEPAAKPAEKQASPAVEKQEAPEVQGTKTQDELIAECLLWIENASTEELQSEEPWIMEALKHVKGTANQLKILRPFNDKRQALRMGSKHE